MLNYQWSNSLFMLMAFCLCCASSGCSPGATFKVIDAKTGKPIEGAVTAAWWTARKGFGGLSHGYTKKVVESVTDAEGIFSIPSYGGSFSAKPRIKVYKPGYIGWDTRQIYLGYLKNAKGSPSCIDRVNYTYASQPIELEPWPENNPEFSYRSHYYFLYDGIPLDLNYELNISTQIDMIEAPKVSQERKEKK